MSRKSYAIIIAVLLMAATAFASADSLESYRNSARHDARKAAWRGADGILWFGTGLIGGAALFPVGVIVIPAGLAFLPAKTPEKLVADIADQNPIYQQQFIKSYRTELRRKRFVTSLFGGVLGGFFYYAITSLQNSKSYPAGLLTVRYSVAIP